MTGDASAAWRPTLTAQRELYDERYARGYRASLDSYETARCAALRRFIPQVAKCSDARRVLDFGCGAGLFVPLWRQVFPDALLCFTDLSSNALERLVGQFPEHSGRALPLDSTGRAPFDTGAFDAVVCVEVLEHVDRLDATLSEVRRLLRPGGALIWTTPCANAGSIEHLYALATGQIDPTPAGSRRWRWEEPTHIRRLTSREMRAALRRAGFEQPRLRYRAHLFSFLCDRLLQRRAPRVSEALMRLDYLWLRRIPLAASMIGAAMRCEDPS